MLNNAILKDCRVGELLHYYPIVGIVCEDKGGNITTQDGFDGYIDEDFSLNYWERGKKKRIEYDENYEFFGEYSGNKYDIIRLIKQRRK